MKIFDLRTSEVAELLGCDSDTVLNMRKRGTLEGVKLDPNSKSLYFFSRAEVEAILGQRRAATKTNKTHGAKAKR